MPAIKDGLIKSGSEKKTLDVIPHCGILRKVGSILILHQKYTANRALLAPDGM